ncbi:hypothetical protein F5B21DRAFT_248678 [Xylaria acuta]|nr:hypothetical protein F5B21DRAFT_248678 [Xylaria acuta]
MAFANVPQAVSLLILYAALRPFLFVCRPRPGRHLVVQAFPSRYSSRYPARSPCQSTVVGCWLTGPLRATA